VKWKLKHLFNNQLRQKYFCQKLLKSANLYSSYVCFFSGFLFISTHISLDLLSLGSAEAYIG